MSSQFVFRLNVSWSAFQQYYHGHAQMVQCYAENGQTLQIHARHFRPLLTASGLQGRFLLSLDDNHQVQQLVKIEN
ncbi:DUF2835 family protein [uncultured Ferrimonas sp.]|uniref:DUF2835 family protein n=1 Tax=uncultured Ferrimonas sp. TaxID=432640 RepID=UPI00261496D4|nr:DUF2835 family protein [uncultured Ferrimonas sp.]